MFLDEQTRCLFVGDALNNNLGVANTMDPSKDNYVGIRQVLNGLNKMQALRDKWDGVYNGHHDFRALGNAAGRGGSPQRHRHLLPDSGRHV